jgi:hypothetical protein
MIARPLGTLWWACGCRQLRKSVLDRKTSTISCSACGQSFSVALLFYRVRLGSRREVKVPLDWTLPIWDLDD